MSLDVHTLDPHQSEANPLAQYRDRVGLNVEMVSPKAVHKS